jgi:hypothetical protein
LSDTELALLSLSPNLKLNSNALRQRLRFRTEATTPSVTRMLSLFALKQHPEAFSADLLPILLAHRENRFEQIAALNVLASICQCNPEASRALLRADRACLDVFQTTLRDGNVPVMHAFENVVCTAFISAEVGNGFSPSTLIQSVVRQLHERFPSHQTTVSIESLQGRVRPSLADGHLSVYARAAAAGIGALCYASVRYGIVLPVYDMYMLRRVPSRALVSAVGVSVLVGLDLVLDSYVRSSDSWWAKHAVWLLAASVVNAGMPYTALPCVVWKLAKHHEDLQFWFPVGRAEVEMLSTKFAS